MSEPTLQGKNRLLVFLLPIMYSWTIIINYILFYVFDLVNYVETNNLDIFHNRFILLSLWAIPVGLTISFTGMFIDYYPTLLNKLVIISLLGSSLSLIVVLFSLLNLDSTIMIVSTILFGFFTGIALITGQTLYSIAIPLKDRNKAYAIVITGASLVCILSIALFDRYSTESPFVIPLIIACFFGILTTLFFVVFARKNRLLWKNDEWPTKLRRIITRPSVIVYFWSHTLIWLMLGLMIGSLAQVQIKKPSTLKVLQDLFAISPYKGFWLVVLFGSLLLVYPAGILSDNLGR